METSLSHEERCAIARKHFQLKGYRVHSGLQFGCELVLYADDPDKVHSDFCVSLVGPDSSVNWLQIQTLARSMSTLHKQLVVVSITSVSKGHEGTIAFTKEGGVMEEQIETSILKSDDSIQYYLVDELAITSGHAPFRHRRNVKHGGGKKCAHYGCEKVARGRTQFCAGHGGGVRCKLDGCTRIAIGKMQLCRAHGGGSKRK